MTDFYGKRKIYYIISALLMIVGIVFLFVNGVKLDITAAMEREFLKKYYRIPLAASCAAYLQSFQVQDYTETYNIMYGFGGLELMTYNYSDAQWSEYVAKAGGTLSYE